MKKCPYCGSQMNEDSIFCSGCGKKFPEGNVCRYCGASIYEGDIYCENCGKKIDEDGIVSESEPIQQIASPREDTVNSDTHEEYEDKPSFIQQYKSYIIGILVLLALVGGSWYGYDAYSKYSAAKQAREKFVADSIAKAKQDSIKLAAKQEAERLENEKIAKFREKFTFNNILELLKHPDNASLASKCGLSLIYKDSVKEEGYEEGQYFTYYQYAYGYDVEKGSKNDEYMGYTIKDSSNHACYFLYINASDDNSFFRFKNKSDADYLFEIAKEYGLVKSGQAYYIPKNKISKGVTNIEDFYPTDDALFDISTPTLNDDWYEVMFNYYSI